jgi:hypothetical protein
MLDNDDIHYKKYLKYKFKYLELKQSGGMPSFFKSKNLTQKTLTDFKNKQKKLDSKIPENYRICLVTYYQIPNLIPNLKTDLTNIKSKFELSLLDEFLTSSNFKNISLNYKKEKEDKVNFLTNFQIIFNMCREQSDHNINSEDILLEYREKITIFKNELTNYINLYLINMEYKEELLEILTIFLNNAIYCINEGLDIILNKKSKRY